MLFVRGTTLLWKQSRFLFILDLFARVSVDCIARIKGCFFLSTYSNLKINHLFRVGRHFVVEAESIFSDRLCSEDEIALALFLALHHDFLHGTDHFVVDIERTTRLDLVR